jgi:hypothetical protein
MLPVNFTIQQLQYLLSFQRIVELDASPIPQQLILIDEAGFSDDEEERKEHHWSTCHIEVPGQRGGNVIVYTAMSHNGVLHRHATLGPYNTAHLHLSIWPFSRQWRMPVVTFQQSPARDG